MSKIRINTQLEDASGAGFFILSAGGGVFDITAHNASSLTDVDTSGATNGDILYFNGTNWVRIAIGSNGETLTVSGGIPSWQGGGGGFTSFDITDGATTQTINDGDIITFSATNSDSGGTETDELDADVSATDAVTFDLASKIPVYINEFGASVAITSGLGDVFYVIPPWMDGKYLLDITYAADTIGGGENTEVNVALNGTIIGASTIGLTNADPIQSVTLVGGILLATEDVLQLEVTGVTGGPTGLTATLLIQ